LYLCITVIHSQRIYGTRVSIVGTVSPNIDVLTYGILVLEIITGRKNGSYDESNKAVNLLIDVSTTFCRSKPVSTCVCVSLFSSSTNNWRPLIVCDRRPSPTLECVVREGVRTDRIQCGGSVSAVRAQLGVVRHARIATSLIRGKVHIQGRDVGWFPTVLPAPPSLREKVSFKMRPHEECRRVDHTSLLSRLALQSHRRRAVDRVSD
jgi:hypothetical protein